jgi:hypothetical protein
MTAPLTREEADQVFAAMAAKGDEIAFDNLAEGCECRAQLMIEHMQALGIEPGRAWAVAVDRDLTFPDPYNRRHSFKWNNHVAPALAVLGAEYGVLVIDPSTQTGAVNLAEWAASMRASAIEVSDAPLSQAEILGRQSARALRGDRLDAVLFSLRIGEPPFRDLGGSGFRIGPDPPEGVSAFARAEMQRLLSKE